MSIYAKAQISSDDCGGDSTISKIHVTLFYAENDDILIDEDGTNQGNRCCLGDSSVYKCIHCEEGEGWNE